MDRKYSLVKLRNGIKILLIPFPKSKLVHIQCQILHGEINENRKTMEYGHILEHMNSKLTSTKHPDAQINADEITKRGGYKNASINAYNTKYYIEGPAKSTDYFLDLMLNSYKNFKMDDKIFEQEKNAVIEERNTKKNSTWRNLRETTDNVMYPNHPYSFTYDERIRNTKKTKMKDLINFRKKYYKTTNTLLIIAGDINKTKILNTIKKELNMKRSVYKQTLPRYRYNVKKSLVYVNTATDSTKLYLHYNIPYRFFDKESDYMSSISNILTKGLNARLYTLRRDHGLIYSISSYKNHDYYNKQLNTFTIETETASKNVPKVIEIILKELNKLKDEYVSKQTVKNLKTSIYVDGLEHKFKLNMEKYINEYSLYTLFNRKIQKIREYYKNRNKISQQKIQRLSNVIFNEKKLLISYGGKINHNEKIKKILKNNKVI